MRRRLRLFAFFIQKTGELQACVYPNVCEPRAYDPYENAADAYGRANACEFFIGIDVSAGVRATGQLDLSRAASSFIDILRVCEPRAGVRRRQQEEGMECTLKLLRREELGMETPPIPEAWRAIEKEEDLVELYSSSLC